MGGLCAVLCSIVKLREGKVMEQISLERVLIPFVGAKLVFALLLTACVPWAITRIAPTDTSSRAQASENSDSVRRMDY